MTKHKWQVWIEVGESFNIVFEGSHSKCLTYYKSHGGEKAGLHIGYDI